MKIKKFIAAAVGLVMLTGCSQTPEQTDLTQASSGPSETTVQTEVTETTQETVQTEQTEQTEETFVLGDDGFLPEYDTFELTSADLQDGVWADIISNSVAGENVSPELSWEPVDGADSYVIYMVDMTAYYFIHWKADAVTQTQLEQGWAQGASYVGPYPPPGSTHTYDIYVVALRNPVDRVRGSVNTQNQNFASFIRGLDTDAEGNSGNIIAYGYLSGEFTAVQN